MKINNRIYHSEIRKTKTGLLKKIYHSFYPVDFHSILRYDRIIDSELLSQVFSKKEKISIIDVGGCLNFSLLFLSIYGSKISEYCLVIYDKKEYENAIAASKFTSFATKLKIVNGDANVLNSFIQTKYDIVFLIDVLEHIHNDKQVVINIFNIMNNSGYFFISVPTYSYKKYFGNQFHKEIGHIRDGYSIKDLEILCKDFNKLKAEYYTNAINSFFMNIYYKHLFKLKFINRIFIIITFPWIKYIINIIEKIKTKTNSSLIYICEK